MYFFNTHVGTFYIKPKLNGWDVLYQDEHLGYYDSHIQAAYEISNGLTFWPSCGNPNLLSIPEDINDWLFDK